MKDLFSNIKLVRCISPVAESGNTAIVGEIVNHQGFSSVCYAILSGVLGDAAATFTVLLEESDDGVSFSAVADGDLLGTEAVASFDQSDDNEQRKIGYRGTKQYTRLTITPANNATSALFAAVAILGDADVRPQSTQAT